ncbi:Serine/threonine-protein kinase CHK1 [Hypsizygus marmoreus]|uniref:non-specific serine/threonine protein kinase n=1 Tax=Hypsizygus marmoreus TaxID=39966 RepID=A0A369K915_HYPMA|nr:Serine/threonine-protein kinase CHK1 [Hypsizygus marmoreus]
MSTVKYPKVVGYQLVQQIGGGGFSRVFRAVNFDEHRVAACKYIAFTDQSTDAERKTIEKEMRIHSALKHKNVLEFMNAVVVELKHAHLYCPGIYMLMELAAGGDLFDKIAPDVGLRDDVAHYYFNQLIAGMDYIHSQGVCHRDLKPENLLLDVAGTLKISDFGLSAVFKLKESGRTRPLTERCGSLPYVAPELNSDEPYFAEPIDVWGIGVILFTMLAGNTPWDEPTKHSPEFSRYLSGAIFDEPPWNRFDANALSIICGMLTVDPRDRFTLADVFQHPWCMRPSQLENQGVTTLADKLTESLRMNGDLGLAAPKFPDANTEDVDEDGDQMMASASHSSQFTQSLMLFSQTQSGNRYTPHLTRFYAALGHTLLMPLIQESLEALNVRCKPAPPSQDPGAPLRLRIGGLDKRKTMFKGWVEVEKFTYRGSVGSFCVMQRDVGNPISWRQLWKALICSPNIDPHVLRK